MALPFDLPLVSRGYAELSGPARAVGAAAARAAERGLAALLGGTATVAARAVPGAPRARAAIAQVAVELGAIPGVALLEVEPGLVVGVVDRLAGGPGEPCAAAALTPVEASMLELLALAAIDGAAEVPEVERALAPRLARGAADPASPLAIALDLELLGLRGRARLLLPAPAIRALRGPLEDLGARAGLSLSASLRRGAAALALDELDALAPGDVVVLDADTDGEERAALVLPGGARITGRLEDETLEVEEIEMTERRLQLPIRLEVELARVELTLAELARLEPGATLPLGIDRRGTVTLRIGERAFGTGELVDVDGAVGVRVLTVEVEP